jgi:peptidylprolyl isomerase
VTLSGELGAVPDFEFTPPLTVAADVARVAQAGTGEQVAQGDAVMVLMASVNGADGAVQGDVDSQVPEMLVANDEAFPPALLEVLVGQCVGARLLYATPDEEGGAIIYSFDVMSTQNVMERAEGAPAAPVAGLPGITLADDGRPSLKPVEGAPPATLVAQPLIVGTGESVKEDSWVVIQYESWLWDGTEISSTWEFGSPYAMPLPEAHEGWRQGLVGRTIGSQMLLVVPPELAFGDEETEDVPVGSTLIFVIDLLAAT